MTAGHAELKRRGGDVVIDADTEDFPPVDETVGVVSRAGDSEGYGVGGRSHDHARRCAIRRDLGSRFVGVRQAVAIAIRIFTVLDAVAIVVFIAVLNLVAVVVAFDSGGAVGGAGVEQHALGGIGADTHGRPALKQVVGVKVFKEQHLSGDCATGRLVAWTRGVTITRGCDRALDVEAAIDWPVHRHADGVLAASGYRAQDVDVARHRSGNADPPCIVAGDADIAEVGQVADQRRLNGNAVRIVAFDQDRSCGLDQNIAGLGSGARDSQAIATSA